MLICKLAAGDWRHAIVGWQQAAGYVAGLVSLRVE